MRTRRTSKPKYSAPKYEKNKNDYDMLFFKVVMLTMASQMVLMMRVTTTATATELR